MKSIWKGSITFGLVNIPIQLFSAIEQHAIGFKLLCGTCENPIEYKRWCPHCKKEVSWSNIEKGLETSKGHYIVLTQDKLKSLKPQTTSAIDIIEFVDTTLIKPVYYDAHYYVAPIDAKQAKAFLLFAQALASSDKTAIGNFVMREKEHVCALQSYENGILLSTLNYQYEIRSMKNVPLVVNKEIKVQPSELKLAKQLIAQLTVKKFDISDFKDTFVEQLKKVLKQSKNKKAGKHKIAEKVKVKSAPKLKTLSLEDILRQSVNHARA